MMGRSHALLGALGYAALEPMTQIELPAQKEVLSVAWAAPFLFTLAAPSTLKNKASVNWLYKPIYWVVMVITVFTGALLAVHWVNDYFPEMFPETPIERFIWMMVAAGFALIPDIDEPNSTVARVFGPVSRAFSAITRELAGGHRKGTHSWIFVILGAGFGLLGMYHPIVAGVIISIAFVFAVRMLVPDKASGAGIFIMAVGVITSWLVVIGSVDLEPLLLAIISGIMLHDLGDWMTNTGIPFWWPAKKKYSANIFSTGSDTENYIVRPIMFVGLLVVMVFWVFIPFTEWLQEPINTSGMMGSFMVTFS